MRTLALSVAALLAAPLLLAGCSAPTAAPTAASSTASGAPATSAAATASADSAVGTQSKLEACGMLAVTMNAAAEDLNSAVEKMGTDPKKTVAGLNTFAQTLKAAVAKLTNPEVKAQGEKAANATQAVADTLEAALKDPNQLPKSTAAFETFKKEMTAVGTLCGG